MKKYLKNTTITEDKKNDENTYYTYIHLKKGLSSENFQYIIDNLIHLCSYYSGNGILEVKIVLPKELDKFRQLEYSNNLVSTEFTILIQTEKNLPDEKVKTLKLENKYTYDTDTGIFTIIHTL